MCLQKCGRTNDTKVLFYVDTSALLKLIYAEAESDVLRSWLVERDRDLVAAEIVETELLRAVRRLSLAHTKLARNMLARIEQIKLHPLLLQQAGLLDPVSMRSLDAIHLAAALSLGNELRGIITYDKRLAGAADSYGLLVVAPS